MYRTDDDLVNKQDHVAAFLDAKRRNEEGRNLYSDEEVQAGEELKAQVEDVYFRRRVFLNYRDNSIAIKVTAPKVLDTYAPEYAELTKYVESHNISVKKLAKSIIFHIAKQ